MSNNLLPILVVSAEHSEQAKNLISELIDNEVNAGENVEGEKNSVWRLENKYYNADVLVVPAAGAEPVPPDVLQRVEAHIIYVSNKENYAVSFADKCTSVLKEAGGLNVCLLLYDDTAAPEALSSWAHSHHYELVPLKETKPLEYDEDSEPSDGLDEPFPERYGMDRARATLHAHSWSGLQRKDLPIRLPSLDGLALSSDEEWAGEEAEEEGGEGEVSEEALVESAEVFAEAVARARAVRVAAGAGNDDERRRRAERALAAFCRALGADIDTL